MELGLIKILGEWQIGQPRRCKLALVTWHKSRCGLLACHKLGVRFRGLGFDVSCMNESSRELSFLENNFVLPLLHILVNTFLSSFKFFKYLIAGSHKTDLPKL